MNSELLESFDQQAMALGFDEVLDRVWPPHKVVELHSHPFDAMAVVTQGEMWLKVGEQTRHLRVGDTFELDRDTPHAERYGAEGATYRVARRNGVRILGPGSGH